MGEFFTWLLHACGAFAVALGVFIALGILYFTLTS